MKKGKLLKKDFMNCINLANESDVLEKLNIPELITVKIFVKDINNVLTSRLTNAFLKYVLKMDEKTKKNDMSKNGYDYYNEKEKVLAEVKTNLYVSSDKLLSNKKIEIRKDIEGLFKQKEKSKKEIINFKDYKKRYMIMFNQKTNKTTILEEIQAIVKDVNKGKNRKFKLYLVLFDMHNKKENKYDIYLWNWKRDEFRQKNV